MIGSKTIKNHSLGIPSAILFNQSILDVFVLQGILELEDAEKLKQNFRTNREIEAFLIKNHLVTKETVNKAYSIILKLPYIELTNIKIERSALDTIPEKIARKLGIIPFDLDGTLLKIAITEPAELPLGFLSAIKKIFKNKKANLELFITGIDDFKEALKQYKDKSDKSILIKKGSLPIVYLRNRKIPRDCLNKIPKSFIEKYRVLVFGENIAGHYLVASQNPDSSITKKILDYIEKENKVRLELFATSESDIDFVLDNYDRDALFKIEEAEPKLPGLKKNDKKEEFKTIVQDNLKSALSTIQRNFTKQKQPILTVDSISPRKKNNVDVEIKFHNKDKEDIIKDNGVKTVSLIGRIPDDYLIKLPKKFIDKYRVVVFGENEKGQLLLATDSPGSQMTEQAISFIKNQHDTEVFRTRSEDIEYALNKYE